MATLVAFCAAFAMLFASESKAQSVVHNPGAFKATITDGTLKIGGSEFAIGGGEDQPRVTGTVDAAGNITIPPSGVFFPSVVLPDSETGAGFDITVNIRATSESWTGNLNPRTGTTSMSGSLRVQLTGGSGLTALGNNCFVGANSGANVIRINPLTSGTLPPNGPAPSVTGIPYNEPTGKTTLVNNTFAVPTTGQSGSSCAALGLGNSTVDGALGLPSPSGQNVAALEFTVNPRLLAPIRGAFSMTPQGGKAPLEVNFDASASTVQRSIRPIAQYRWDFDGDGTVDEVSSTPTITHTYTLPGDYEPTLTVVATGGSQPTDTVKKDLSVTGAVVSFVEKPDRFTQDDVATFEFANSEGDEYECRIDGATEWEECENPLVLEDLAEGEHTLEVRGLDDEGVPGLPISHTWTVDQTKPVAQITGGPPARVNADTTSADITFSASDNASAAADLVFECRRNGGDWESCSSPTNVSWPNEEASHGFDVRVTDQAGNVSEVVSRGWTVDLTAPTTDLTDKPINILNGQFATESNPTNQTANANSDFAFNSNEPGSFVCKLNGGEERPCLTPIQLGSGDQGSPSQERLGQPNEGTNTFKVWAVDEAGNRDPDGQTYSFAFDSVQPQVTLPAGFLPSSNRLQSGNFNVLALSTEPVADTSLGTPGNGFECSVANTASWGPCTEQVSNTMARYRQSSLATNTHYNIRVRATDAAGNVSTGANVGSFPFAVDTTAPVATIANINDGPMNGSVTNEDSARFQWSGTDAFPTGENATLRYECRVDSQPFESCGTGASQTKTFSDLDDGSHTFEVRPIDQAGNVGAVVSRTWTIGEGSVELTAKPNKYAQGTASSFSFVVADGVVDPEADPQPTVAFQCRNKSATPFDNLGTGWAACTSPRNFTATNNNTNWFEVRAVVDGTPQFPTVYRWIVDGTNPAVSFAATSPGVSVSGLGLRTNANQTSGTVTYSATDTNLDTVECRYGSTAEINNNEVAFEPCASGTNQSVPVSWEAVDGNSRSFQVRATDLSGRVTTQTRTWVVDAVPPIISAGWTGPARTSQTGQQNSVNRFGYISNETASASYRCIWNDGEEEACINTGSATVTIPSSVNPGTNITQSMPTVQTGETTCVLIIICTNRIGNPQEGENTLTIIPIDGAGNRGEPLTRSFIYDTTPPRIEAADGQPAEFRTNAEDVTIEFDSNEPVLRFECATAETGPWTTCSDSSDGAEAGSHTFVDPTEGPKSLFVRGVDKATPANTSGAGRIAEFQFVVDRTDPITEILDGPAEDETVATDSPTFEVAAINEDGGINQFECRIDGGTPPPVDPEDPEDPEGPGEGDGNGEGDGEGEPAGQRLDEEDPGEGDENGDGNGDEEQPEEPVEGLWEPCGEAEADDPTEITVEELDDGEHTFEVRAIDEAGNTGEKDMRTFSTDTTGPGIEFTSGPDEFTNQTDGLIEFEADEPVELIECSFDGGEWEECDSPYALENLADGEYFLDVSATDVLGNMGDTYTYEWTVDTRAPITEIESSPAELTNSPTAKFTYSANEPVTGYECRLDAGEWESCDSEGHELSGVGEGNHTFEVRSTDRAGNTSEAAEHSWRVDRTAPIATITSGPTGNVIATTAELRFNANEQGSTFECRLNDGAPVPCSAPVVYRNLTVGPKAFRVRATDRAGNRGQWVTQQWTVVAPQSPELQLRKKVKVPRNGAATIGTARCGQHGSCTFTRRKARLKVGKRSFSVKITGPARLASGSSATIKVKPSKKAARALRKAGKGRLQVKLTLVSENGTQASAEEKLRAVPAKRRG